jgi:hypothetical protein
LEVGRPSHTHTPKILTMEELILLEEDRMERKVEENSFILLFLFFTLSYKWMNA